MRIGSGAIELIVLKSVIPVPQVPYALCFYYRQLRPDQSHLARNDAISDRLTANAATRPSPCRGDRLSGRDVETRIPRFVYVHRRVIVIGREIKPQSRPIAFEKHRILRDRAIGFPRFDIHQDLVDDLFVLQVNQVESTEVILLYERGTAADRV